MTLEYIGAFPDKEGDMGFAKTREELERYYNIGLRKFFGAKMLGVMLETEPEIVARLQYYWDDPNPAQKVLIGGTWQSVGLMRVDL